MSIPIVSKIYKQTKGFLDINPGDILVNKESGYRFLCVSLTELERNMHPSLYYQVLQDMPCVPVRFITDKYYGWIREQKLKYFYYYHKAST